MTQIPDGRADKFPGTTVCYAIFFRRKSTHNPLDWKMLGRPTTEHISLRDMMMPQNLLDSEMYGVPWYDDDTDTEYKIMEMTVVRSEWRNEQQR